MKIGITGGIGSGKSYVCKLLAARGITVYDCDAAAKRLMRTSPTLRRQLTELIGTNTYQPDGTLNKAVVAQFLLASEQNAKAIDAIVHPAVFRDFIESGVDWMESAILYESGINRLVDRVLVVTAPEPVRIRRIMQRDGISAEKAREWIDRQWPQDRIRALADYEIVNDGETDLPSQVDSLLARINQEKTSF
jgi:dephospho-CoA kinase